MVSWAQDHIAQPAAAFWSRFWLPLVWHGGTFIALIAVVFQWWRIF